MNSVITHSQPIPKSSNILTISDLRVKSSKRGIVIVINFYRCCNKNYEGREQRVQKNNHYRYYQLASTVTTISPHIAVLIPHSHQEAV